MYKRQGSYCRNCTIEDYSVISSWRPLNLGQIWFRRSLIFPPRTSQTLHYEVIDVDIASWLKNLLFGILECCGANPDNKKDFNVFRNVGNFVALHSLVEYLVSCRYLQSPSQLVELPAHIIINTCYPPCRRSLTSR